MGDHRLVESVFDHGGDVGNVLARADSPENIFTILEELEKSLIGDGDHRFRKWVSSGDVGNRQDQSEPDGDNPRPTKRPKLASKTSLPPLSPSPAVESGAPQDGQQRMSHITVERNRRKQMNEHLSVLRSLMPCFYVKRGDQASIIGGVVDFIKELQQLLQSLEAKKQRKVYSEVLSPRPVLSPRLPSSLSPRLALPPPHSPRINLPISPRTPQPSSPYKTRLMQHPTNIYLAPTPLPVIETPPPSPFENVKELAANSKSPVAEVEVKFSGANVLLKTVSHRIPGQATKIVAALEGLSLEILNASISVVDDTMLNSFTIKIGIECELSAEELAHEVQLTFC